MDADGLCDVGDTDDDGDGVADDQDRAPLDAERCEDTDQDGCDDCSVTGGPPDPAADGPDRDGDGICDAGETGEDGENDQNDQVGEGDADNPDPDGEDSDPCGDEPSRAGGLCEPPADDPPSGDGGGGGCSTANGASRRIEGPLLIALLMGLLLRPRRQRAERRR